MLSNQRLLVVESVVLIALDIQRIVDDSHASETVFARDFAEAAALAEGAGEFDLAIINAPEPHDLPLVEKLLAGGTAIVVSTATPIDLAGTPLADATTVLKPFSDEQLRAACREALERRKGS